MSDPRRSALVVVAHADDETLGSGGTIAWLASCGWEVRVVVVSDGVVPRASGASDHRAAAAGACEVLGASPPTFLGLTDQRFEDVPVGELAERLADLGRPDVVITHDDTDLNGDHRRVAEAALVAWRPSAHGPSILAAEIPGSTTWSGRPFAANYYVDISATMPVKLAALECYGAELRDPPHPRSVEGVRATAAYHGLQSGCGAAEAFRVVRGLAGRLP